MSKKNTYVDDLIAPLVVKMHNQKLDSKEYNESLDQLIKLQKIRQEEKPDQVKPDTLVMAAVNLLGIGMILRHENMNVITSKALTFISQVKLK